MRFFGKLFLIAFIFGSNFSSAAEPGETFAKSIASATKWDQLFRGMKDHLNPLVLKELTALTNDLPYPMMRVHKGKLHLSSENGDHLTVIFFQRNGAISFNGKEYKYRPLASTEAEVERVMKIIASRNAGNAFLDILVPSAQAANLGMGVAAAAVASSAAWKGKACSKEDISSELRAECSVMAVAMQEPTPFDNTVIPGPPNFYPVDLKCPANNNGTLEVVSKRKDGAAIKIEATYRNAQATSIAMLQAPVGSKFSQVLRGKPDELTDPSIKLKAERARSHADALLTNVCLASREEYQRHMNLIAANRTIIVTGNATDPASNSDRKTSTGL